MDEEAQDKHAEEEELQMEVSDETLPNEQEGNICEEEEQTGIFPSTASHTNGQPEENGGGENVPSAHEDGEEINLAVGANSGAKHLRLVNVKTEVPSSDDDTYGSEEGMDEEPMESPHQLGPSQMYIKQEPEYEYDTSDQASFQAAHSQEAATSVLRQMLNTRAHCIDQGSALTAKASPASKNRRRPMSRSKSKPASSKQKTARENVFKVLVISSGDESDLDCEEQTCLSLSDVTDDIEDDSDGDEDSLQYTNAKQPESQNKEQSISPAASLSSHDPSVELMVAKDMSIWTSSPTPGTDISNRSPFKPQLGKAVSCDGVDSPSEAFELFVDRLMVSRIVRYTNEEGARQQAEKWKMTDEIEIRAFIGCLINLGAMHQSLMPERLIWNKVYGNNFVRLVMSRERFRELSKALCFDDSGKRMVRKEEDYFAPFRDMMDTFSANLRNHYVPGSCITIGEQLLKWKGKCNTLEDVPSDSKKSGIKIFWAVDANSFYPLEGILHLGKHDKQAANETGRSIATILTSPYLNSGKNVTCHDFFTDKQLSDDLLENGVTVVGTVKRSKQFLPPQIVQKNIRRHESVFAFNKSTTLVNYKPSEKRNMIVLSTLHKTASIVDGRKKVPEIVSFYNSTKGGVDAMCKMAASMTTRRASSKWPVCLFYNLLDISCVAALVIMRYKMPNDSLCNKKNGRFFHLSIAHDLVEQQVKRRSLEINISRPLREMMDVVLSCYRSTAGSGPDRLRPSEATGNDSGQKLDRNETPGSGGGSTSDRNETEMIRCNSGLTSDAANDCEKGRSHSGPCSVKVTNITVEYDSDPSEDKTVTPVTVESDSGLGTNKVMTLKAAELDSGPNSDRAMKCETDESDSGQISDEIVIYETAEFESDLSVDKVSEIAGSSIGHIGPSSKRKKTKNTDEFDKPLTKLRKGRCSYCPRKLDRKGYNTCERCKKFLCTDHALRMCPYCVPSLSDVGPSVDKKRPEEASEGYRQQTKFKRRRCAFCPRKKDRKSPYLCEGCKKHVCANHVHKLCPSCVSS